jgi:hypothetical protein
MQLELVEKPNLKHTPNEGDDFSAVLQINGRWWYRICDQAEMLMRMHMMWAEKTVIVMNPTPGWRCC